MLAQEKSIRLERIEMSLHILDQFSFLCDNQNASRADNWQSQFSGDIARCLVIDDNQLRADLNGKADSFSLTGSKRGTKRPCMNWLSRGSSGESKTAP